MPDPVPLLSSVLQVSLLEGWLDAPIDSLLWTPRRGVAAFIATLVAGAIALSMYPEYTEKRVADVREGPGLAFVSGFFSLVFLLVVSIVLVWTAIGIAVAIPLLIATYLLWAVGWTIAFLAVADHFVGNEDGWGDDDGQEDDIGRDENGGRGKDGWGKPLLVAASVNGLLTLTGVGGLLSLVVGAAGMGAVLREPP